MCTTHLTLDDFKQLLKTNPGMVILKFGAEWCGPCKRCEKQVRKWFDKINSKYITTIVVDIDESFEIYAFLKNKKMIQGIPAILMYKKGNLNYTFDDSVNTSDNTQIDEFFQRCMK